MSAFRNPSLILAPLLAGIALSCALPAQGMLGGTVHPGPRGPAEDCVPAHVRAAAIASMAPLSFDPADGGGGPAKFAFYPQGGTLGKDLFIGSYVDLDPGPGFHDWNCSAYSYDGHLGCDSEIRTFGEQAIGVPVFAVQDGIVVAAVDGAPDMNTSWTGQAGNYIIVSGAGGRQTSYWHLRQWSVAVAVGQTVRAGEQIAETASSGNSAAPHLHFEVWDGATLVEPWAGPCRAGESEWLQQPPWNGPLYAGDFAFSRVSPATSPYPYSPPRSGQWVQTDPWLYFWLLAHNIPPNSTYRLRFLRPNGTVAQDDGPYPLGNPALWQWAWWWWAWDVPEMRSLAGTWTMLLDLNGQTVATAPIEVFPVEVPGFNRPPEPVTVSLEPAEPAAGDAIIARVEQDLILDDLDYDIVRYTYVWKVNGQTVRTRTSAGRADMIPRHTAFGGDTVSCEVAASDGTASGAPATASVLVRALAADPSSLSVSQGGAIGFRIDYGPAAASLPYVFAASLSGTSPGILLAPGFEVPLVWDPLTTWMLDFPNTFPYSQTLGTLDASGRAQPALLVPPGFPAGFANLQLHHAAVVPGPVLRITNPATIITLP